MGKLWCGFVVREKRPSPVSTTAATTSQPPSGATVRLPYLSVLREVYPYPYPSIPTHTQQPCMKARRTLSPTQPCPVASSDSKQNPPRPPQAYTILLLYTRTHPHGMHYIYITYILSSGKRRGLARAKRYAIAEASYYLPLGREPRRVR